MTPIAATATAEQPAITRRPEPAGQPQTVADTGLHPDTLAQLMLKSLISGETSGTQLAESLRLPYSVLDAMVQHARVEKLIESNTAAHTRVAVALEALSGQVREVRDDVTPVDAGRGRYHLGRMKRGDE